MRIVSRTVATLLLLSLVTAGLFAAGAEEGSATERMTISMRPFTNRGTTLAPDSVVELFIEDYFNIDLEPWYGIDFYDTEARNVRFASGDVPDILQEFAASWVDLGIVRELNRSLIRQHLPGYMKWADHYLGDEVWRRTTVDGVNYAVPTALSMASTSRVMGFRADWLRAVGYDPEPVPGKPFFRGPDTLEEIEEVLTAFRNEDPDGNGQKDSYGYMIWKNDTNFGTTFLPTVFGAFGVQLFIWDVKDGEGYYSMVDPNYKEALKYVNRWYEKGIIHPDTVSNVRADVLRAMSNGEFGAWSELDAWQSNYNAGPWGAYREANPDGDIAYSVTPAGPDGNRGSWYRDPNWTPWSIGINADDAKVVKIMQMIEEIYTDANLYAHLFIGGPEGEFYEWNDGGYAVPVESVAAKDAAGGTTLGVRILNYPPHIVPPIDKVYIAPNRHGLQAFIEENQAPGPGYGFRPVFNDDERALQSNIQTIEQEFAWQAVTGQIDIDAAWDGYVKNMMDAGLRQLLATTKAQR